MAMGFGSPVGNLLDFNIIPYYGKNKAGWCRQEVEVKSELEIRDRGNEVWQRKERLI
jgi:hypothetical protein